MRATAFTLFIALAVTSCTFRVPTVAEQQKLLEMGAFPTGAPAWISPAARGEASGAVASSGIVPLSFSAQPSQSSAVAFSTGEVSSNAFEAPPQPRLPVAPPAAAKAPSPLERISAACPDIESAVSSALTTTEPDIRIKKYEGLVKRCPESIDLQLWLARDYLRTGSFSRATQSVEAVLRTENQHLEARALLGEIKKAQLQRQVPTAPPQLP